MINIFNLFLTLFFFWMLLTISNNKFSWAYVFIGIGVSTLVSFFCWKIKIINKNSHFLFLHIGFYKHFSGLIIFSFISCIAMILKIAFSKTPITAKIHKIPLEKINSNQLALLIPTINLTKNLLFIGFKNNQLSVANFGSDVFGKNELMKILENLSKINDNRLV